MDGRLIDVRFWRSMIYNKTIKHIFHLPSIPLVIRILIGMKQIRKKEETKREYTSWYNGSRTIIIIVAFLSFFSVVSAHTFSHASSHTSHKKVPRKRLRGSHMFVSPRIISHNLHLLASLLGGTLYHPLLWYMVPFTWFHQNNE